MITCSPCSTVYIKYSFLAFYRLLDMLSELLFSSPPPPPFQSLWLYIDLRDRCTGPSCDHDSLFTHVSPQPISSRTVFPRREKLIISAAFIAILEPLHVAPAQHIFIHCSISALHVSCMFVLQQLVCLSEKSLISSRYMCFREIDICRNNMNKTFECLHVLIHRQRLTG